MHPVQEKLLKLISEKSIGNLTLRQIGELIKEKLPQTVKHHLNQLEHKGFIMIDLKNKTIKRVTNKSDANNILISIPILGSANCCAAALYAYENIEGYLKISKT